MEQDLLQLEEKVTELTEWKQNREDDRLSFPVDTMSRKTLDRDLFVFTGRTFPFPLTGLAALTSFATEVKINDKKRQLIFTLELLPFTVNAGTDVFTNTNGEHNLQNGQQIGLATTSLLPGGLNSTTIYYIINRTGTTFKVSTSLGGSAVDVLDAGLGTQYYGILS
jgi:hypothetical protein